LSPFSGGYPTTDQIIIFTADGFLLGQNNAVNKAADHFYWVSLRIPPGDPLEHLIKIWQAVGGPGNTAQVTGLQFTPAFAMALRFLSTANNHNNWRSPVNVGNASQVFGAGNKTDAANGITAFGDGTIDLGSLIATNGTVVNGFAMLGSGTYIVPPSAVVFPSGVDSHSDGGGTGDSGCRSTVAASGGGGNACSSTITPGAGSVN
jgi:hypothetical protein